VYIYTKQKEEEEEQKKKKKKKCGRRPKLHEDGKRRSKSQKHKSLKLGCCQA
jgi:hypothetical protein